VRVLPATLPCTVQLEPFVRAPVRVHFLDELVIFSRHLFLGRIHIRGLPKFDWLLEGPQLCLEELLLELLFLEHLLLLLPDELLAEHLVVMLHEGGVLRLGRRVAQESQFRRLPFEAQLVVLAPKDLLERVIDLQLAVLSHLVVLALQDLLQIVLGRPHLVGRCRNQWRHHRSLLASSHDLWLLPNLQRGAQSHLN
jgi:hypothetical protein